MVAQNFEKDAVFSALQDALSAGSLAGNARIAQLAKQTPSPGKILEACGGSTLTLDVDGRTQLGRLLASFDGPNISVRKAHGAGFHVHFPYNFSYIPPVNGQEWSIRHDANLAAAAFIQERLGIRAYALPYMD